MDINVVSVNDCDHSSVSSIQSDCLSITHQFYGTSEASYDQRNHEIARFNRDIRIRRAELNQLKVTGKLLDHRYRSELVQLNRTKNSKGRELWLKQYRSKRFITFQQYKDSLMKCSLPCHDISNGTLKAEANLLRAQHHEWMGDRQREIVTNINQGMIDFMWTTLPEIRDEKALAEEVGQNQVRKMRQSKDEMVDNYEAHLRVQRKYISKLQMAILEQQHKEKKEDSVKMELLKVAAGEASQSTMEGSVLRASAEARINARKEAVQRSIDRRKKTVAEARRSNLEMDSSEEKAIELASLSMSASSSPLQQSFRRSSSYSPQNQSRTKSSSSSSDEQDTSKETATTEATNETPKETTATEATNNIAKETTTTALANGTSNSETMSNSETARQPDQKNVDLTTKSSVSSETLTTTLPSTTIETNSSFDVSSSNKPSDSGKKMEVAVTANEDKRDGRSSPKPQDDDRNGEDETHSDANEKGREKMIEKSLDEKGERTQMISSRDTSSLREVGNILSSSSSNGGRGGGNPGSSMTGRGGQGTAGSRRIPESGGRGGKAGRTTGSTTRQTLLDRAQAARDKSGGGVSAGTSRVGVTRPSSLGGRGSTRTARGSGTTGRGRSSAGRGSGRASSDLLERARLARQNGASAGARPTGTGTVGAGRGRGSMAGTQTGSNRRLTGASTSTRTGATGLRRSGLSEERRAQLRSRNGIKKPTGSNPTTTAAAAKKNGVTSKPSQ